MKTHMRKRWVHGLAIGSVVCAGALGLSGRAQAQANPPGKKVKEELVAPTPPTPKSGGMNLGQLGLAIVILGVVAGVSLIPSKRGHQD